MSRSPVRIVADLLDAGWPVADVEFDTDAGTVVIAIRTPPIAIDSKDPQLAHLLARAMGGTKEPS